MNSSVDKPGTKPSRRQMRWWKKLGYSLFTTLLFFALLESGLALVGLSPTNDTDDPFVGFTGSSPLFVTGSNDSRMMVTAPNKLAYFNQQRFLRHKPSGVIRVFCLGGSTTYGRPYDDATSFAGWLRELLPRVAPDTAWEIINAGGVSYASYRVARLAEELVQYEPDLLIVYTGQNEFLEERTYRNILRTSILQRHLTATLAQTRTYALAQRLLGRQRVPRKADRFQMPEEVDAVLDHTVGPTSYVRNDELRRQILDHFAINLARIVHIGRRSGAQVMLVTPASNLKDCSPFKSLHTKELSAESLRRWTKFYAEAKRLERGRKPEEALTTYRRAAQIDSRFAELHWRKGRLLLKLRQFAAARTAFRRAVDEDVCPLRAISEIPEIVRDTADQMNVPLVDFERLINRRCRQQLGHTSPGNEFFLDHVHPTIATNSQLAVAIIARLAENGRFKIRSGPTKELMDTVSRRIESHIDARKHAIALRNLAKVLNWAGKHHEAGSLALRAVKQLPEDPEALVISAAFLARTGRTLQAIEHYRRALRHRPDYATAHQMLGATLVDRGALNEALKHFIALARLRPEDAHAWQMIGAIYAEQGHFSKALPSYEQAASLNPDDADIQYNLANALGHLGHHHAAIEHYARAVELNPDDADAHNNLGVMLMQEGRMSAAASHFRQVLRLRPSDKTATANLRDAENKLRQNRTPRSD